MGEVPAMPDSIDRLKQLLFDSEAQTLADLARRIEDFSGEAKSAHAGLAADLQSLSESEDRSRSEIAARIDEIAARVGTDARLEERVAAVLDGALRRAEQAKHAAVADAVAPFVVNTVRTEIRNSKDELVEALYPVTGRIVKAYVASAMKDLVDQINRRLEMNPVMLRVRSLATGRSVAELAIADSQRLVVEELYLIRRGTGELVERWPAGGGNRDQVMSGVLTAINEFATEAFDAGTNALRQIDLGADRVYLRESVAYLLAAKCSGQAPVAVEQVIDDAFLQSVGKLGSAARDERPPVLPDLADHLTASIESKHAEFSGRGRAASPVKILGLLVGLPLAAWFAWTVYADWRVERTERVAREILFESAEIRGYPAKVEAGRLGESLSVTGLSPDASAKRTLIERLQRALPGVTITDDLATVPNPLADVEPELDRLRGKADELSRAIVAEAEKRDLNRAASRLTRARATLAALAADVEGNERTRTDEAIKALERTLGELDTAGTGSLDAAVDRTRSAVRNLATILPARPTTPADRDSSPTPVSAMLTASEEAEIVALALAQAVAVRKALPVKSPREKLEAWTRAHAIFFSDDDTYRDPAEAGRRLGELSGLMSGNDIVVRVIGYTDGLGGSDRNSPLSLSRAEKVESALIAAGVPRDRLVVLGRTDLRNIAEDEGTGSPNRRVEFEVGFEGEARR
jgi:outer membrane protein OmpA-like peptidoglycan-associated protein